MDEIISHLRTKLNTEFEQLERRRNQLLRLINSLSWPSKDSELSYRIELESLWGDHGEKDVTTRGRGPLDQVLARAIRKFKATNRRSDVQAKCVVYAKLPMAREEFRLDARLWQKRFDELKNE